MTTGRFGPFGGQYIPETLMNEIHRLEAAYNHYKADPDFQAELKDLLDNYANRPSLLYYAGKMTEDLGGAKIYLKREDLNHTGAHKINNALGQCLLAKKMGKTRVIAETGAGQHGVATATAAAFLGLECEVFMGEEDTIRQALNVYRMELLGAKVHAVTSGSRVLKDAVNEAMREWVSRVSDTHYVIGSAMGPSRLWSVISRLSSVKKRESKFSNGKASCRQRSWPVWAVVPMPLACSITLFPIRVSASLAVKPLAGASIRSNMQRPLPKARLASSTV